MFPCVFDVYFRSVFVVAIHKLEVKQDDGPQKGTTFACVMALRVVVVDFLEMLIVAFNC